MKVVLELKEPLTEQEIARLPLLLRDAFGEFMLRRGILFHDERDEAGIRKYYADRYGDDGGYYSNFRRDKLQQLRERGAQAQKLYDAEVVIDA